jgi:hypothetical protein
VLAQTSNPSAIQRTVTYSVNIVDIFPFHMPCNPADLPTLIWAMSRSWSCTIL